MAFHEGSDPELQGSDEADSQDARQPPEEESPGQPMVDQVPVPGVVDQGGPDGRHVEFGDEGCPAEPPGPLLHLLPDIFRRNAELGGCVLEDFPSQDG